MSPAVPKLRWTRSMLMALWIAISLFGLLLVIQPVSSIRVHAVELLALTVFLVGALMLGWRRRMVRFAILAPVVIAVTAFLMPGRNYDRAALRAANVRALRSYDGVAYVWGGESGRGVDCSGLIRRGLMDACQSEGVRTFNPMLLRSALTLWWHDCSARALGEGYRELTRPIAEATSINALDHTGLNRGDLAVTAGGAHILAFLGEHEWMQAAPEVGHAASFAVPSTNGWFHNPVKLVRWHLLE